MIATYTGEGPILTIDVHFDLICPWCYIGKRQLTLARGRFAEASPGVAVEMTWAPMQLLPDMPEAGVPFAEFYLRRLGSPEAVAQRKQQVASAAAGAGLDIDLDRIQRMPNTARAHRLLLRVATLGRPALHETLLDRLFVAYFQRGEDIGDAATLAHIAEEIGVPPECVADASDALTLARAGSAIASVPTFVFNGRLALAGAQDPTILVLAMRRAMLVPADAEGVRA